MKTNPDDPYGMGYRRVTILYTIYKIEILKKEKV